MFLKPGLKTSKSLNPLRSLCSLQPLEVEPALCLKQDISISSKAGCGGVCLGSQLCGSGGRRIAAGSASVRVTVGDGEVEHMETHPTPEGLRDSRGVETRYDCTREVRGVSGAGRPLCGPGGINSLCFLS